MANLRLHIPYTITEWDDGMLVPLDKNFGEIQRHVAALEIRMDAAEARLTILEST